MTYKCRNWINNIKKNKRLERDQSKKIVYVEGFYIILCQNFCFQDKGLSYSKARQH